MLDGFTSGQSKRSANRINMDGPQTEDGGRETVLEDNVVRLPRDWLGPRDELIPFGASAPGQDDEPSEGFGPPPTANDFWGEDSSSLQSALEAPASEQSSSPTSRIPPSVTDGTRSRRPFWRGFPVSLARAREAARGRARIFILAAVLGLLSAVALLVTSINRSPVSGLQAAATGRSSPAGNTRADLASKTRSVSTIGSSVRAHTRSVRHARSAAIHERTRPRLRGAYKSRHAANRSTVVVERVRYTSSPSVSSRDGTGASSPAPAPPTTVPTTSASNNSSSRQSNSGKQSATGANGALAPGSSPDG